MSYYQDGADFYEEGTNRHLFTSSVVVKDFDSDAAKKAREEFLRKFPDRREVADEA
jgi:hypothetical protein